MLNTAAVQILGGMTVLAVFAGAATARGAEEASLREQLEVVSRHGVFFGHQSVGFNLVEGLQSLAAAQGVPLRVVRTDTGAGIAPSTFAHGVVAENGDPRKKLRSFEAILTGGAPPEVALVKFCYVDFEAGTDVAALFAEYQATLARLKAKYPRTTFVYVTAPLTTIQSGPRAIAKRLLGRPPGSVLENVRRDAFNSLMRSAARDGPLFDLARVESTAPDGTEHTFTWNGKRVPALVPSYTDDGGHLNAEGKTRAARELVSVLASTLRLAAAKAEGVRPEP